MLQGHMGLPLPLGALQFFLQLRPALLLVTPIRMEAEVGEGGRRWRGIWAGPVCAPQGHLRRACL